MTLTRWAENSWLRAHRTSSQEVGDLLKIVGRDLQYAANPGLSADWKFGISYNAALKLCTILLSASGYRAEKNLQHFRTLQALPLIMGDAKKADADYLDTCRNKRNIADYDRTGVVSESEAEELRAFVGELRGEVLAWLNKYHTELI
jgi:hypothetical protein